MGKFGLINLVSSAKTRHTHVLKPAVKSVYPPIKRSLPGILPNSSEIGTAMGRFYEYLTTGLYGGYANDVKFTVPVGEDQMRNAKPDVIDDVNKRIWECKSSSQGRSSNMMNRQLAVNVVLQTERWPDYEFFYGFFKHDLKGARSTYRNTIEGLFKDLSEKVIFSVILPFDVIVHLAMPFAENGSSGSRIIRHYPGNETGSRYEPCACLNSGSLNGLFLKTEEKLEEIGLDPSDYNIQRFVSPEEIMVDGNEVRKFPIVWVKRKNNRRWVKEFREDEDRVKGLVDYLLYDPRKEEKKDEKGYPKFWDDV